MVLGRGIKVSERLRQGTGNAALPLEGVGLILTRNWVPRSERLYYIQCMHDKVYQVMYITLDASSRVVRSDVATPYL